MGIGGQNLGEEIGHVILGGDKDEAHDFVGDLLSQPRHFDAEVAVPPCDNMVVDHCNTCLVVLEQL